MLLETWYFKTYFYASGNLYYNHMPRPKQQAIELQKCVLCAQTREPDLKARLGRYLAMDFQNVSDR